MTRVMKPVRNSASKSMYEYWTRTQTDWNLPMAGTKLLTCVDCGAEVEFLDRDAVFYQEKGWEPPRRCKGCRVKKHPETKIRRRSKNGNGDKEDGAAPAESALTLATKYKVNCATCGAESVVPFKPDPTRPVYCRNCLNKAHAARRARL